MTTRAALEADVKAHPFLIGMSEHHLRLLADCAMLTHFAPASGMVLRDYCEKDHSLGFSRE